VKRTGDARGVLPAGLIVVRQYHDGSAAEGFTECRGLPESSAARAARVRGRHLTQAAEVLRILLALHDEDRRGRISLQEFWQPERHARNTVELVHVGVGAGRIGTTLSKVLPGEAKDLE
jgi:hypothetical protein